jgi:hypothetical protein
MLTHALPPACATCRISGGASILAHFLPVMISAAV